jgi:hypothetical protein
MNIKWRQRNIHASLLSSHVVLKCSGAYALFQITKNKTTDLGLKGSL